MGPNFDILRRTLWPLTKAELDALVRTSNAASPGEQLTLADAGLKDEVRQLLASRDAKNDVAGPS